MYRLSFMSSTRVFTLIFCQQTSPNPSHYFYVLKLLRLESLTTITPELFIKLILQYTKFPVSGDRHAGNDQYF